MQLTVDFDPQVSERLTEVALSRGVAPATVLANLVKDHLSPIASSSGYSQFPPTGRAAPWIRARLAAEATDDPEEIRKDQEELDEMKRSMNEERLRSGAEPIF